MEYWWNGERTIPKKGVEHRTHRTGVSILRIWVTDISRLTLLWACILQCASPSPSLLHLPEPPVTSLGPVSPPRFCVTSGAPLAPGALPQSHPQHPRTSHQQMENLHTVVHIRTAMGFTLQLVHSSNNLATIWKINLMSDFLNMLGFYPLGSKFWPKMGMFKLFCLGTKQFSRELECVKAFLHEWEESFY